MWPVPTLPNGALTKIGPERNPNGPRLYTPALAATMPSYAGSVAYAPLEPKPFTEQ